MGTIWTCHELEFRGYSYSHHFLHTCQHNGCERDIFESNRGGFFLTNPAFTLTDLGNEPSNLVLQSLPFSYVYIDVESNDGQEHSVQLYSDITAGACILWHS